MKSSENCRVEGFVGLLQPLKQCYSQVPSRVWRVPDNRAQRRPYDTTPAAHHHNTHKRGQIPSSLNKINSHYSFIKRCNRSLLQLLRSCSLRNSDEREPRARISTSSDKSPDKGSLALVLTFQHSCLGASSAGWVQSARQVSRRCWCDNAFDHGISFKRHKPGELKGRRPLPYGRFRKVV